MSNALVNWSSRVTIAARIAERLRSPSANEATLGDYHTPFGKTEAKGCEVALAGHYHLKSLRAQARGRM